MSRLEQQPPAPDPTPEGVTLSAAEHEALRRQAEEAASYKDRYLRAVADFDNAKKRLDRDREDAIKFSSERIVRQLLPILDSFEQALRAMEGAADQDSTRAGVRLIFKQLTELLQKEGVQRIEALGTLFDLHRHEAIQQVDTCDAPDNQILEEVQAGYLLNGQVLRPSLVKVAKHIAKTS